MDLIEDGFYFLNLDQLRLYLELVKAESVSIIKKRDLQRNILKGFSNWIRKEDFIDSRVKVYK